jgi:hypothetical protein
MGEYVTPAFDESFYPSLYSDDIRPAVLTALAEKYATLAGDPGVRERFERYRQTPPSASMRAVERFLNETAITPQIGGTLSALRLESGDPAAPLDALNLDGALPPATTE